MLATRLAPHGSTTGPFYQNITTRPTNKGDWAAAQSIGRISPRPTFRRKTPYFNIASLSCHGGGGVRVESQPPPSQEQWKGVLVEQREDLTDFLPLTVSGVERITQTVGVAIDGTPLEW